MITNDELQLVGGLPVYRIKAAAIPDVRKQFFPPEFVMIFDHELRPITPINQFTLKFGVRGKRRQKDWKNTQSAYADDLANWVMYCHYNEIPILEATRTDISDYKAVLFDAISQQSRSELKRNTVSRRIGTVVDFYKFAFQEGWLRQPVLVDTPSKIDPSSEVSTSHRLSAVDPLVPPSTSGGKVRYIPPNHQQNILKELGPDTKEPNIMPSRDRTAAEWAAATGMRVEEIASITLLDILNLDRRRDEARGGVLEFEIIGKRAKARQVEVPIHLLDVTLRYVATTRALIIERMVFLGLNRPLSGALFLNGVGSNNRDIGKRATADTLSRAFTEAVRKAGLTLSEEKHVIGPDGTALIVDGAYQKTIVEMPMYSIHAERHTFVITMYWRLKEHGDSNPWKKIQQLVGHSSILTTIDIYAQHMPLHEDRVSDALNEKWRSYDRRGRN